MDMKLWHFPMALLILLLGYHVSGSAQTKTASAGASTISNKPDVKGVITKFDFRYVDDLLRLKDLKAKMVIFPQASENDISSAHLEMFKRWISGGGIGYFYSDGLGCSLFRKLDIADLTRHMVIKENNVRFSFQKGIGELFIRDLLPAIVIHSHKITDGVNQLYVGPVGDYNRSENESIGFVIGFNPKTRFIPILQLGSVGSSIERYIFVNGSSKENATIFGVSELGSGLIVVDGTGLMLGKNSLNGNTYDWPKMYANILNYASR